jgi:hypothetical protein
MSEKSACVVTFTEFELLLLQHRKCMTFCSSTIMIIMPPSALSKLQSIDVLRHGKLEFDCPTLTVVMMEAKAEKCVKTSGVLLILDRGKVSWTRTHSLTWTTSVNACSKHIQQQLDECQHWSEEVRSIRTQELLMCKERNDMEAPRSQTPS